MVTIYSADGNIRFETPIFEGSRRVASLMGDDYITLKFDHPTPLAFWPGDYVVIPDIGRFEIIEQPKPRYNEQSGYEYDLKFEAYYKKWRNKLFRFSPSVGAAEASWSLTAPLYQHLEIILANLKALGLDRKSVV